MKNLSCLAVATLGLATLAGSAQASNFVFTYHDGVTTASGTLTATDNGGGTYTAIAGLLNVTSGGFQSGSYDLLPGSGNSPSGAFVYDNQLYPAGGSGSFLDSFGLLFTRNDPTLGYSEVNIWGNNDPSHDSGYQYTYAGGYVVSQNDGTFTLTLVPVPAASLTGLAGLAGLGVFGRRRVRA